MLLHAAFYTAAREEHGGHIRTGGWHGSGWPRRWRRMSRVEPCTSLTVPLPPSLRARRAPTTNTRFAECLVRPRSVIALAALRLESARAVCAEASAEVVAAPRLRLASMGLWGVPMNLPTIYTATCPSLVIAGKSAAQAISKGVEPEEPSALGP